MARRDTSPTSQADLAEISQLLLGSGLFGVVQLDAERRIVGQHGGVLPALPMGEHIEEALPLFVGYEETIAEIARGERLVQHLPDLRGMGSQAPGKYFSIYILARSSAPGTTLLFHDTSELSGLRQEIMQTKNDLQIAMREVEQVKSRFYGMMSHEIRTPLHAVIGTLQNLEDAGFDPRNAEPLRVALGSAHHLLRLLNDILDFSKIEAGRLDLESLALDLPGLVGEVRELMSADARVEEHGLVLRAEIDAAVPATVRGDPGRIRQILLNLVGNAIKFTEAGQVTIRVSVPREGIVAFEVADTGIGIRPEAQTRLFAEYAQLESSTSRRFGGTGLGLTICKRLVELMKGEMGVMSAPGEGSTFWFELPLERCDALDVSGAPGRILVVDDGETSRLVLRTMLQSAGHEVDAVENGREAVEAVRARPYDLVLMDVYMPVLDGPGAAAAIRGLEGERSRTPILAMSASSEISGTHDTRHFDGSVDKPIAKAALLAAVARWLR